MELAGGRKILCGEAISTLVPVYIRKGVYEYKHTYVLSTLNKPVLQHVRL